MADNFKTLQQDIVDKINNAGGPGSIPSEDHRNILLELLSKVGKYTGAPFKARREPNTGIVPVGTFFWNNNAMNDANQITVTFSARSSDLNPIIEHVKRLSVGSLIHFKDYSGRSGLYKYISHAEAVDPVDGDIINMVIQSVGSTNPNYTYQASDDEISVIEFFSVNPNAIPYGNITFRQNQANGTAGNPIPSGGDYAEGVLSNGKVMDFGIYVAGAILDEGSYDPDTIVISYDPNDL